MNHGCFIHTDLNVGESCAVFKYRCIEGTTCDDETKTCRKYYPEAAVGGRRVEEFTIIIIYPLTTRVVGAPQIISQPISTTFACSPLPSWTKQKLQRR